MPSVSKQQQKFFGLVRALQKGDVSPSSVTKKARDAAKDMKKSDVKKYAATKHKGLPRKVRGETKVRELIKKMVREILDEEKIKGINEGKLKEGFADNFIKTVDKHNQKIVNNALALAKQQAPKDIDKSSKKTPKLIAIKTINRMKELRNKTKSPALKKTFQKTIDKLEKDYKKIKEGKLKEINKSHFMDMVDGEINSLKGQIAYAQDAMKQKGVEDWEKKEYKAVLKDAQRRLKDKLSHKKRLSKLGEGKLKENRKEIAQTILQQLGGNKFIAMTGAKNLGFDSKGSKTTLSFKIGRNAKSINYVKVDYISGKDLYDMSFFRLRAGQLKLIKKVSSIYGDQLQKFFTKNTGLYTRL